LLAWLAVYRPDVGTEDRAAGMPERVGEFTVVRRNALTPREYALLGTRDVVWRTYRANAGPPVFVIAVFHEANWKSVHPPHICLRGSDMVLRTDQRRRVLLGARSVEVGEIQAHSRSARRDYLSWFVYGGPGLATPSYAAFVLHHLPRALFRRNGPGFLLRVETWIDGGDVETARGRCRQLLEGLLPAAEARLR
jgi:EpsI family protein